MAEHLKRCLHTWEVVHHINGIVTDNRIENLMILDKHTHIVDTITKTYIKRLLSKISKLESQLEHQITMALPH
jgi:hypothetical protein